MNKKIPQRMCVGCQILYNKRELLRIVKTPEGEFLIDNTGKKAGRGAYICDNKNCFSKAYKEKRLEKSFKMQISESVYEDLKTRIFSDE